MMNMQRILRIPIIWAVWNIFASSLAVSRLRKSRMRSSERRCNAFSCTTFLLACADNTFGADALNGLYWFWTNHIRLIAVSVSVACIKSIERTALRFSTKLRHSLAMKPTPVHKSVQAECPIGFESFKGRHSTHYGQTKGHRADEYTIKYRQISLRWAQ